MKNNNSLYERKNINEAKKPDKFFLIMINVIVFVLMFLFGGLKAFSNPRIYILFGGAQIGNLISMGGEWFRLITSMFVHGGLFHIFFLI